MLANILKDLENYKGLKRKIGTEPLHFAGLTESAQVLLIQDLLDKGPVLAVFATQDDAKKFYFFASDNFSKDKIAFYPPAPYLPVSTFASSKEAVRSRANILHRLAAKENFFVISSIEALTWKVAQKELLSKRFLSFEVGEKLQHAETMAELIELGYERVDMVNEEGQFARRGGILDVFPSGSDNPLRIEFWGDEIDSLRNFDAASQRSLENLKYTKILPVNEIPLSTKDLNLATEGLQKELSAHKGRLAKAKDKAAVKTIEEQTLPFIEAFKQGIAKDGLEQFYYLFNIPKSNFSEYFSSGTLLLFDEKKLKQSIKEITKDKELALADYLASGLTLPGFIENSWTAEQTIHALNTNYSLAIDYIPQGGKPYISFMNKEIPTYNGDVARFKNALDNWKKLKYAIVFTAATPEQGKKLQEYLKEIDYHITVLKDEHFPLTPGGIYLALGYRLKGLEWPALNTVIIDYSDVFGTATKKSRPKKQRTGQKIASFLELKVGDYIVHTNHGIGIYKGVEKVTALGVEKDYLLIQYAGTDKLYVPTEQVERVQKYVGAEGHTPKLNKLGGTDWAKAKSKIKESVQEMAKELLRLYAEREAIAGFAFPPDNEWQKEFEETFPYEETADQIRAITEIKKDMQAKLPMDRLLCGDVGYGKTEVAMRAAFKAVSSGKQVAILIPTTVLAQQHEQTFKERFANYPISIAALSRFKSAKEQKEILEKAKIGTLDILIGTHRLLSKDVNFKNLGLLIVDEEQRFGVAHKERIKQLRSNVDVLTLSATPIPRTLHMSLVGMRDMSVIETPPADRLPVQTYVLEYNDRIIQEAIKYELARGGQVFFVHNRVQDLKRVVGHIQKLVPEATVVYAHGQMNEDELEDVMYGFINNDADVLVTTTIIESGLDMPNVNTLIVDDADKFGLSQMYQLRGRVGRAARQAFAYFTYRRDKILTEIAQKRLKAIRDFTELGSGFKIAMRDLELRGAGNILGPEQHGHIMTVGFDMYVRLLEEAVEELKGVQPQEKEPVSLELAVNAFLPDAYVEDSGIKTEIYHKLLAAESVEDVEDIREETEDRFGNLPQQTENLFNLSTLRVLAEQLFIRQISFKNNKISLVFTRTNIFTAKELTPLVKRYGRNLEFDFQAALEIRLKLVTMSEKEILDKTKELLLELKSVVTQ